MIMPGLFYDSVLMVDTRTTHYRRSIVAFSADSWRTAASFFFILFRFLYAAGFFSSKSAIFLLLYIEACLRGL